MAEDLSSHRSGDSGEVDWQQHYAELGRDPDGALLGDAEVKPGPGAAAYRIRGRQIREHFSQVHGEGTPDATLDAAGRRFLGHDAESPEMQAYTKAALDAPIALRVFGAEQQIKRDLAALPANRLREREELSGRQQKLSRTFSSYRTALRDVIISSRGAIDREELADTLARTSGDEKWVHAVLLPEVTAAVAAYDYFSELEQMESVTLANPDQVAREHWQMSVKLKGEDGFRVAPKHQGHEPRGNVAFGRGDIMELGLPNAVLKGFVVAEKGRDVLDKQVKLALDHRYEGSVHVYRTG